MNYIGSKHSLLNFIDNGIQKVTDDNFQTVCDIFAGTGAVGRYFKQKGKQIISNDIQYYSYVLNRNYIGNHQPLQFNGLAFAKDIDIESRKEAVCDYLNKIEGVNGFIYNNYCLGSGSERCYFTDDNGKKCDAIRLQIELWKNEHKITDDEYFFLLASLLESIDKVANTASVYGAFLKKVKSSAIKDISLQPANFTYNDMNHKVFNADSNSIVENIKTDILYLDPPYNQRQYNANYHILETIAKYDNPKIEGKTGLRKSKNTKSLYCSRLTVKNTFKDLIQKANAKYIFLSYNNEGLLSLNDIEEIMREKGDYGLFKQEYSRFMADKNNNRKYKSNKTMEYLHYVIVR